MKSKLEIGVQSSSQIVGSINDAKEEIRSISQTPKEQQCFNNIANFATKAKPYVDKKIKVTNIALTIRE